MQFRNRHDAGQRLAAALVTEGLDHPVVLALPRGGVPVAYEVAVALGAPLDVFVARKVGAPGHPEFGIGAVAEGGFQVVDRRAVDGLGVSDAQFAELARRERHELGRRVRAYRADRALPELSGRDVVLVDDGLATGVTAEAALGALRARGPRRLVLAVPACAPDTAQRLRDIADAVVCVVAPESFSAVGQWYERFDQTSDAEVLDLLARGTGPLRGDQEAARRAHRDGSAPSTTEPFSRPGNARATRGPPTAAQEGDDHERSPRRRDDP